MAGHGSAAAFLLLVTQIIVAACEELHTEAATETPLSVCDYSIIMPGVVFLKERFEVHVALGERTQATIATCELQFYEGNENALNPFHVERLIAARKTFKIQAPAEEGRHSLKVVGNCHLPEEQLDCLIENTTEIHALERRSNIMIELDKPVYKPSQQIEGRVVAVDGLLRPLTGKIPLIYISDSTRARIAQWHDVEVSNGIASFSLPLSSEPVLGNWTVTVKGFAGLDLVMQKFKVDEYVLPKFDISVEAPKCITSETSEVCINVEAKYTHGNPVKGEIEAFFQVVPKRRNGFRYAYLTRQEKESFGVLSGFNYFRVIPEATRLSQRSSEGTRLCLGLNDVSVTVSPSFPPGPGRVRSWKLVASWLFEIATLNISTTFREAGTGIVRNTANPVTCFKKEQYALKFEEAGAFPLGMPLKGMVTLSRADSLPLPTSKNISVECSAKYPGTGDNSQVLFSKSKQADEAGRVLFEIDYVPCGAEEVVCKAQYIRYVAASASKTYKPRYSPSGSFLKLSDKSLSLKVGKQANIPLCYISCHEQEIVSVNFVINARGHLLHSGSLDISATAMNSVTKECQDVDITEPPQFTGQIENGENERGSGGWGRFRRSEEETVVPRGSEDIDQGPEVNFETTVTVTPPHRPQPPLRQGACPCSCRSTCDLDVEFTVDTNMGPNGKLIVYTTLSTGEMVVDTVDFSIDNVFANKVGMAFDSDSYRPGQTAKIHFSAAPGSKLAYSAVDKSLHILGGKNQITPERALAPLYFGQGKAPNFDAYRNCPPLRSKRSPFYFPNHPTFVDALEAWKESDMVIVTSHSLATRPCYQPKPKWTGHFEYGIYDMPVGLLPIAFETPTFLSPTKDVPQVVVEFESKRSFFPETWLFKTLQMKEGQRMENISVKVPDTITSWSAAAYAISSELGIGVANPVDITVVQPFFLTMKLPYSVIRGEILELPVSVFNYVPGCTQVSVELLSGHCHVNTGGVAVQELCLCTSDVDTVKFNISFNTYGDCPIVVSAKTGGLGVCERPGEEPANILAADQVTRTMKVEPGGIEMENLESRYVVKKPQEKPFSTCFNINPPEDIVTGSGRAFLSIVGDLLGPSLEGLENLLKLPYGCGEQNMLNFAPGVSIAKYLIETDQLDFMQAVKDKAIKVLQTGYQRQNMYRHRNGAYSAFGEKSWHSSTSSGCLWLTAFVVKTFCKAKSTSLIDIDQRLVCESVNWIAGRQAEDGSFADDNCLHHKGLAGGAQTTYTHTAYICLGLIELNATACSCGSDRLATTIRKCTRYLGSARPQVLTPYALAISCLALTTVNSVDATATCDKLDEARPEGQCYWGVQSPVARQCAFRSFFCLPPQPSANVETTAYGLLANLRRDKDPFDNVCIAKWLVEQRNSNGGFRSTQDTIVALEALSVLSGQSYRNDANNTKALKVSYRYKPDNTNIFDTEQHHISRRNKLVVFKRELRPIPGELCVHLRGTGSALLQVATRYNVREQVPDAAFRLQAFVRHIKDAMYSVKVCTSWLRTDTPASNMALVTIKLPSGFIALPDELDALKKNGTLQLERWDIDGRQVFFYFEEITTAPLCFSITIDQDSIVDKKQPTFVRVQDYYEPQHEATVEYTLTDHPTCGQNFTYDACDASCGAVFCREHLSGTATECRACVSGCRCKDNYLRLGDECILQSDCKKLLNICPTNQAYSECASTCPRTCEDILNPAPRICPSACHRGCACRKGYVLERKTSDKCVLEEDCSN